jgi:hypothetical protein
MLLCLCCKIGYIKQIRKAGTRKNQPAEAHPKSNTLEHFVKSIKNQGQILAKITLRFTDIARYTLPGIEIFALYFCEIFS